LRILTVQIQPERAPVDVPSVLRAFERVAEQKSLVIDREFTSGDDSGRYLNFSFFTRDHAGLWAYITKNVYSDPALGEALAASSIAVCNGVDDSGGHTVLHHFDSAS